MGSLRSVSRILTSPPQQDKRARSGSLRLHSAQTKGGEQFGTNWGETPPGPGKSRPGSRFPPRPLFLPPRKATVVPAVLITVEGASKTSAHDRGRWTRVPRCARPARIPHRARDCGRCPDPAARPCRRGIVRAAEPGRTRCYPRSSDGNRCQGGCLPGPAGLPWERCRPHRAGTPPS